jgi:sulfatase maturation enzyme AslB (radical SAM superfamily)
MGEEEVDLTHSILYCVCRKMCHGSFVCHIKATNDANGDLYACRKICIVETTDSTKLARSPFN